jgi:hypothetical protein
MVLEMMGRMRSELGLDQCKIVPEVDQLIIFDRYVANQPAAINMRDGVLMYLNVPTACARTVDMVTPMLSQLTYEGMIDEIYGIKNCMVD